MKASIGRIVHYRNTATEGTYQNGAEVVPAMIVRVHNDEVVNLAIFHDAQGPNARKTGVVRGSQPGQWDWPGIV